MKRVVKSLCLCAAVCAGLIASGQKAEVATIRKHITYLASDELGGRMPGSEGEKLAQKYIAAEFKKYGLTPKGTAENSFYQHFTYQMSKNPHDTTEATTGELYHGSNVIGYLDNKAEFTIVIGAHYDHLGDGTRGNSLDANPKGKIHHGADDNASGTAGVLELARIFTSNGVTEKYNILFIAFSAEEAGLIGSKYYVNHPTIPLKATSCMINMDMIGRLNDSTRKVIVYGTGTSNVWEPLLDHTRSDVVPKFDSAGVGPSDQTSFYLRNIPVLFFFTGQHSDYHKPTDVADKINYEGEKRVIDLVAQVVDSLQNYPRLSFQMTTTHESKTSTFKVSLGIMPDYAYDKPGVRVDGVTDNKPAQKAGLKADDVIIQLGDYPVKDIYSYMDALNKFDKGKTTKVIVQRGGEKKEFEVTF